MRRHAPWILVLLLVTARDAAACGSLAQTYQRALDAGRTAEADSFLTGLRASGPQGLELLLDEQEMLQQWLAKPDLRDEVRSQFQRNLQTLAGMIDAVGAQRHCSASRLYWYTDLESACRASRETGRPILSLRMLGRLTDELSCANSRFFRTTLYPDPAISKLLREQFILHWESERPAPVVTIDFGDGRRMLRTLTGNSAHYLLDADGRPIDCLPGLYGPRAFLDWLTAAGEVARQVRQTPEQWSKLVTAYHASRLQAIANRWEGDLQRLQALSGEADVHAARQIWDSVAGAALSPVDDDRLWTLFAHLHIDDVQFSEPAVTLVASTLPPNAVEAGRLAISKSRVEMPLLARLLRQLRTNVAADSVRNEYLLHRRIHEWFVHAGSALALDELNRRVYAELFLTPADDPWLGLLTRDAYTGLVNAGVTIEPASE